MQKKISYPYLLIVLALFILSFIMLLFSPAFASESKFETYMEPSQSVLWFKEYERGYTSPMLYPSSTLPLRSGNLAVVYKYTTVPQQFRIDILSDTGQTLLQSKNFGISGIIPYATRNRGQIEIIKTMETTAGHILVLGTYKDSCLVATGNNTGSFLFCINPLDLSVFFLKALYNETNEIVFEDRINDVIETSTAYVVGGNYTTSSYSHPVILGLDKSDGSVVFQEDETTRRTGYEISLNSLIATSDGGFFAVGRSNHPSVPNYDSNNKSYSSDPPWKCHDGYMVQYSAPNEGLVTRIWDKCYGTLSVDSYDWVTSVSDGFIILADYALYDSPNTVGGIEITFQQDQHLTLQKVDTQGNLKWIEHIGSKSVGGITSDTLLNVRVEADDHLRLLAKIGFGNKSIIVTGDAVNNIYHGSALWDATIDCTPGENHEPLEIIEQKTLFGVWSYLSTQGSPNLPMVQWLDNANYLICAQREYFGHVLFVFEEQKFHDISSTLNTTATPPLYSGNPFNVTHEIQNSGPDDLANAKATLTVTPAESMTGIQVQDAIGDTHTINGNILTLYRNQISKEAPRQSIINLQISPTYVGSITINSTLELLNGADSVTTNNTSSLAVTILEPPHTCDTYVTLSVSEKETLGSYTGRLTFGNKGSFTAENATIQYLLDSRVDVVTAQPEGYTTSVNEQEQTVLTWSVGNLTSGYFNETIGDPATFYIVHAQLKDGVERGTLLKDTVNIVSDTDDADLTGIGSQNSKDFLYGLIPGLDLTLHAGNTMIHTDAEVLPTYSFEVQILNNGNASAHDLEVRVAVPSEFKNLQYSMPQRSGLNLSFDTLLNEIVCEFDTLDSKEEVFLTCSAEVHSWFNSNDNNFDLEAEVSGKSNTSFTEADLGDLESTTCFVWQPDLAVELSYPGNQQPFLVWDRSVLPKKKVQINFTNLGAGNSHAVIYDVLVHDPNENIDAISITDASFNIQNIQQTAEGFRFEIKNPLYQYLGLTGSESTRFSVLNSTANIVFELEYDPLDLYFDSVKVELQPTYAPDPYFQNTIVADDYPLADFDLSDNDASSFIDFVDPLLSASHTSYYDTKTGDVLHELNSQFNYRASGFSFIPLTQLETTITLPFYKDQGYEIPCEISYYSTSYKSVVLNIPTRNGFQFENELPLWEGAHKIYTIFEAPIEDFSPTYLAANSFPCTVDVSFMVAGDATVYHISLNTAFSIEASRPRIFSPGNGEYLDTYLPIPIEGFARPLAQLSLVNANTQAVIDTTTATAGGAFLFYTVDEDFLLDPISFYVCEGSPTPNSIKSETITLIESGTCWCPQRSFWQGKSVAGKDYMFTFRDKTGKFSTTNWTLPGVYGFWDTKLYLYVNPDIIGEVYVIADNVKYENYKVLGNYYVFDIGLAHNIMFYADCGCLNKQKSSNGSILIDPDGFVFDSGLGFSHVVPGAEVTCMFYDEVNKNWLPWPAHAYNNQVNPQIVDETGYFAFFTPPGTYRLEVRNPQPYQNWTSPDLTVVDQLVTQNIPYAKNIEGDADYQLLVTQNGITYGHGTDATTMTIQEDQSVRFNVHVPATVPSAQIAEEQLHPVIRLLSTIPVESNVAGFDSGLLSPYDSFVFTFSYPGTYVYTYDHKDETKTATIVVTGAETVDTEAPTMPSALQAQKNGEGEVTLSWQTSTDNAGILGYRVYRKVLPSEEVVLLTTTQVLWYSDRQLTSNTDYQYYVQAVDLSGLSSAQSNAVTVQIGVIPPPQEPEEEPPVQKPLVIEGIPILQWSIELLEEELKEDHTPLILDLTETILPAGIQLSPEQVALLVEGEHALEVQTSLGVLEIPAPCFDPAIPFTLLFHELDPADLSSAVQGTPLVLMKVEVLSPLHAAATFHPHFSDESEANGELFTWIAQSPFKVLATEPTPTEALSWTDSFQMVISSVQPEPEVVQHWAARAFTFAQLRGILYETDVHALATPLTRGTFTTMIAKALNLQPAEDAHPFFDLTEDHVQNAAIQAAVHSGLVTGYPNGNFEPERLLTREEALMILSRCLHLNPVEIDAKAELAQFADAGEIDTWAIEGISACLKARLVEGNAQGKIVPHASLTTAEAAALMYRLLLHLEA